MDYCDVFINCLDPHQLFFVRNEKSLNIILIFRTTSRLLSVTALQNNVLIKPGLEVQRGLYKALGVEQISAQYETNGLSDISSLI